MSQPSRIRVLVVDDHVVRQGLIGMLERPDIVIVGQAQWA